MRGRLALVALAAFGGAAVKLGGAVVYGSRSLLADALTSIANLAALVVSARFYLQSREPPDEDHPYGHERLALAGSAVTALLYAGVAGYLLALSLEVHPYTVGRGAPAAAAVGAALYTLGILASRGLGEAFRGYSALTWSEVLESIVVIVSSYLGASVSYLADYLGSLLILGYVAVEVALSTRDVLEVYTDPAAPPSVYAAVARSIEESGFRVVRLRIRRKTRDTYQGDVIVACPAGARVGEVHERLSRVLEELRRRHSVDLVAALQPCGGE